MTVKRGGGSGRPEPLRPRVGLRGPSRPRTPRFPLLLYTHSLLLCVICARVCLADLPSAMANGWVAISQRVPPLSPHRLIRPAHKLADHLRERSQPLWVDQHIRVVHLVRCPSSAARPTARSQLTRVRSPPPRSLSSCLASLSCVHARLSLHACFCSRRSASIRSSSSTGAANRSKGSASCVEGPATTPAAVRGPTCTHGLLCASIDVETRFLTPRCRFCRTSSA